MVNEIEGWPHAEFDGFCDRLCNLIQAEKYGKKTLLPVQPATFRRGGRLNNRPNRRTYAPTQAEHPPSRKKAETQTKQN